MYQEKAVSTTLVAIVIVAVFAGGVTVYAETHGGLHWAAPILEPTASPSASSPSTSNAPLLTPTPTTTETTPISSGNVATADSLEFTVQATNSSGTVYTYKFYVKNLQESNILVRVETSDSSGNQVLIVDAGQQKAWLQTSGIWVDVSSYYTTYYNTYKNDIALYQQSLASWSGSGDYTFVDPSSGYTVRIYDITVNPTLSDSLFQAT